MVKDHDGIYEARSKVFGIAYKSEFSIILVPVM
jgi:hypothetical protein